MTNCIPCPPCEAEVPLVCEPYGTVAAGNRVVVEDDAFCTNALANPSGPSTLIWDNEVRWERRNNLSLQAFSNNAAAVAGGLIVNDIYKTPTGEIRIVV